MNRKIIIGGAAIVLSIAFLLTQEGGSLIHPAQATTTTPTAAKVTDLNNLEPLKQAFQRDRGTVRLVALLSPI